MSSRIARSVKALSPIGDKRSTIVKGSVPIGPRRSTMPLSSPAQMTWLSLVTTVTTNAKITSMAQERDSRKAHGGGRTLIPSCPSLSAEGVYIFGRTAVEELLGSRSPRPVPPPFRKKRTLREEGVK
jgi:hypothetical protein